MKAVFALIIMLGTTSAFAQKVIHHIPADESAYARGEIEKITIEPASKAVCASYVAHAVRANMNPTKHQSAAYNKARTHYLRSYCGSEHDFARATNAGIKKETKKNFAIRAKAHADYKAQKHVMSNTREPLTIRPVAARPQVAGTSPSKKSSN